MSDELEQRLRDSLRAYAGLVDAPETADPPIRAATPADPRPALRRWRAAVLAAAAVAAVVTGSFWVMTDDVPVAEPAAGSVMSTAEPSSEPPATDTSAGEAAAAVPGQSEALPSAPEVGVVYRVDLYTHCGVLGLDIGGVWFAADPPLVEDPAGPPQGWGNPDQPGTVTLLAADRAVFRDDAGHEVRLRADDGARPPLCA